MSSTDTARQAYYGRVGKLALSPLWTTRLVPPSPKDQVKATPYLWDYDNVVRPMLLESGPLITAKEANRRVLTLENPGSAARIAFWNRFTPACSSCCPAKSRRRIAIRPRRCASSSKAKAPRPRCAARRSYMHRGDFIITPSMTWHDHGHDGNGPVFWMDGLDIPMVGTFGPMFFENYGGERHPNGARPATASPAMAPICGR